MFELATQVPPRSFRLRSRSGLVGATGVEPVTSSLSWKRSYQLSYAPCAAVYRIRFDLRHFDAILTLFPLYICMRAFLCAFRVQQSLGRKFRPKCCPAAVG